MEAKNSSNNNARTFYTLVATQTLSLIGSRISGLALGIWIFNQTGNATPLALVAFFGLIPQVVLSSFAGVLADRWDRRYVMAIADAGQAVGTVLLLISFVVNGDSMPLWHLYVIALIQALFGVFQGPAFSASITMLIPDDQRDRANAIQQLTGPTAGIIAPMIAGFVFAAIGVVGAIMIDLVTFIVAFVVVLMVRIPRPRKTEEGAALSGTIWQEMWGGLRYMWQRPNLFWLVMTIMLLNFILAGLGVLFTPYILARTGSETAYGIIMGLFNAGGLVGGIIIGVWGGTRPRMRTIVPAAVIMGLLVAGIGFAQTAPALAVMCFLMFLPNPMINALFASMLQAKVAPDVQGRVFAALGQISMVGMPIAYLLVGPLADNVFEPMVQQDSWQTFAPFLGSEAGAGMGLMFVIFGLASAAVSLLLFVYPAFRNIERDLPDFVAEPAADEVIPELATA